MVQVISHYRRSNNASGTPMSATGRPALTAVTGQTNLQTCIPSLVWLMRCERNIQQQTLAVTTTGGNSESRDDKRLIEWCEKR